MNHDKFTFGLAGKIAGFAGGIILVCVFGIFALTYGQAYYKIFLLEMDGKAKLAEAEYSKRIMVEDARAKRDSATLLAEGEVERAKGVAEANKIIGSSLQNNESYLRYLWVKGLNDGHSEVIYVPTEANLPILEATRRLKKE
jgi:hypothetical protein